MRRLRRARAARRSRRRLAWGPWWAWKARAATALLARSLADRRPGREAQTGLLWAAEPGGRQAVSAPISAEQCRGAREDAVEHRPCESAREGVLLARMIGAEQHHAPGQQT